MSKTEVKEVMNFLIDKYLDELKCKEVFLEGVLDMREDIQKVINKIETLFPNDKDAQDIINDLKEIAGNKNE